MTYSGLVSAMVQNTLATLAPIASPEVYQVLLEELSKLENAVEITESMEGN